MHIEECKEKQIATNVERYGVEHTLSSPEIRAKGQETNMKNFGVPFCTMSAVVQAKTVATCLRRYGANHPSQTQEFKDKIQETCMIRYGETHPMKDPVMADKAMKASYYRKDYTLPSGKIIQVQGYEPYALDLLFAAEYEEDDIVTDLKEVPHLTYHTSDGCAHKYFPDIYVKSDNWIIEVKSTWTLEKSKEVLPLKKQACVDAGYHFDVWAFDGN